MECHHLIRYQQVYVKITACNVQVSAIDVELSGFNVKISACKLFK